MEEIVIQLNVDRNMVIQNATINGDTTNNRDVWEQYLLLVKPEPFNKPNNFKLTIRRYSGVAGVQPWVVVTAGIRMTDQTATIRPNFLIINEQQNDDSTRFFYDNQPNFTYQVVLCESTTTLKSKSCFVYVNTLPFLIAQTNRQRIDDIFSCGRKVDLVFPQPVDPVQRQQQDENGIDILVNANPTCNDNFDPNFDSPTQTFV